LCPAASEEESIRLQIWADDHTEHYEEYERSGKSAIRTYTAGCLQDGFHKSSKKIGPGHDNLSGDHLRQLCHGKEGEELAQLIAWFIDRALVHPGSLPQLCTDFHQGAEIVALQQPGGKIRPVQKATELRKAADAHIINETRDKLATHFAGLQYGVGTPNGSEKMIATIRTAMEANTGADNTRSDFENAFNRIPRHLVLTETAKMSPGCMHSKILGMKNPNTATYVGDPEGVHQIRVQTGRPQGAPASSIDYATATLALIKETQQITSGSEGVSAAYVDDTSHVADHEASLAVLDHLIREGPTRGSTLNLRKQHVLIGLSASFEEAQQKQADYLVRGCTLERHPIVPICIQTMYCRIQNYWPT